MKTIVFLGTNKSGSSRDAIKAAENLGYFTVLLTNRSRFLEQREEFPEVHHMEYIDLHDDRKIREALEKFQDRGFILQTIASFIEPFVYKAAILSEEFCQTNLSTDAIFTMENKIYTRDALSHLSSTPDFFIYKHDEPLDEFISQHQSKLPLIVKSPDSTGSKDVILAKNNEDFQLAMKSLLSKYPDAPVLVEEYLEGPQYLVETVIRNGKLEIIGIVEQTIEKKERFIVIGYLMNPFPNTELYIDLYNAINPIMKELEMANGAAHFEFRKVKNKWKLIEVNPRVSGGVMNKLIQASTGINLMEETLKLFLGEEPSFTPIKGRYSYAHYLTVDQEGFIKKITGKSRASRYEGVEHVYVKPRKGQRVRSPLSMGHRYGYVLASDNQKEEAIKIAQQASQEIEFHILEE